MTIDLLALAKKANETYIDVECSFGVLRVYHVPDAALLSASISRHEPQRPVVVMKTAIGTEERESKKGDKEYDQWKEDLAAYNEEMFQMRNAIGMVMALKDLDWSEVPLDKPPTDLASALYNGHWPENELLRKKLWLDYTIIARRDDQEKILVAMQEMRGENEPTSDQVDEVKKNSA